MLKFRKHFNGLGRHCWLGLSWADNFNGLGRYLLLHLITL
jgi:hypothetical protein